MSDIKKIINDAWEIKDQINKNSDKSIIESINQIIEDLDNGKLRVAEKKDNKWTVNQWAKKAVLLSFRLIDMSLQSGGPQNRNSWDKVDNKFISIVTPK